MMYAAAIFALAAAAVPAQFNLACTGMTETTSPPASKVSEPFVAVYRIDLARGQYCEGTCREINRIATVQPAYIQLYKTDSDTPSGISRSENIIDRITGSQMIVYRWEARGRSLGFRSVYTDAQCQRQPFTGFPSFDTKF